MAKHKNQFMPVLVNFEKLISKLKVRKMKTSGLKSMKRYGNIFAKICDMDNLILAHRCAKEDKLFYKEVIMVDENPEKYLTKIQSMLKEGKYLVRPEDYNVSTINDKGKERELWKLSYYPHRIIQWAIMLQIEGVFMEVFCTHTCASLKERGIKHAYNLTKGYMKNQYASRYCLKIDISKFYPNINHEILKQLLRKKFKDQELLSLLDMLIDSFPGERGVPIGSYLSQYLANFYLAYFDHWLKEEMKVKRIVRYMDDVVIFHHSKVYLHLLLFKMSAYLASRLKVKIKTNWQIFPAGIRGVDFVGYRFFYGFILLRKSTCRKFKKKMLHVRAKYEAGRMLNYNEWCAANSYIGWLGWCDSWRLFEKYVQPILPSLLLYYGENIKRDAQPKEKVVSFMRYKRKLLSKKGRIAA